jgi:glycosyltransferase involved in cell wall biosynthesis
MAAQAAGVPAVFWQQGIPGPSFIERAAGAILAQAIACCSHAAARLVEARADLRFMVVGGAILGWEGSYPNDLRRPAADLGAADRVYFAGHQADVLPWFDALDVVVHASFGEPFGLVLVEDMALGKPLVATNLRGPLEIIEGGTSGLLVPPGDPERLAEGVERILVDRMLASNLEPGRGGTGQGVHRGAHGGEIRGLLKAVIAGGPRVRDDPAG